MFNISVRSNTSSETDENNESILSIDYFPLQFVNISVVDAPLLKDIYWMSLRMLEFTDILLKINKPSLYVHNFCIPPMPIYSKSIKIIFHIVNKADFKVEWFIQRKKLCNCKLIEIPKTINTFQKTYNCLHRNLLDIQPREGSLNPNEISQIVLSVEYNFVGLHNLAFEMIIMKIFKIRFNFTMEIFEFDPFKCILNTTLSPVYFEDEQRYFQPIWIHNPFNIDLNFEFDNNEREVILETKKVCIEKHCTRPLVLAYDPNYLGSFEVKLNAKFLGFSDDYNNDDDISTKLIINGEVIQHSIPASSNCPNQDIPCKEAPFVLYKNSISVILKPVTSTTRMIVVANHYHTCAQFRWKNFSIKGLFDIVIEPISKYVNPGRSIHFIVKIQSKQNLCIFHHIPVECEIFNGEKILRKQQLDIEVGGGISLLDEDDDIDRSLIEEYRFLNDSFITKILLDVSIEIKGKPMALIVQNEDYTSDTLLDKKFKFEESVYVKLCKILRNFIFSEDFINYAIDYKELNYGSYTNLLEVDQEDDENESRYDELQDNLDKFLSINKDISSVIMHSLLEGAISEIASERRFIPREYALPIDFNNDFIRE